jgi:hypothetical protein
MKIKSLLVALFGSSLLSLSTVKADLITPPSFYVISGIAILLIAGVVIGVVALISWLIIRMIKKKNASKSPN